MARYISTNPIKGSKGGATFQKSGMVNSIRKHNVPIQKRSPAQSKSKNQFESFQTKYRTLTGSERLSFQEEAMNYPRINSLGDVYYMNGINLQNSSNTNLINSNSQPITEMPPPVDFPFFQIFTLSFFVNPQNALFVITPFVVPDDFNLLVFATRPLSPGAQPPSHSYNLLYTLPPGIPTQSLNVFPFYLAQYGDTSKQIGSIIHVSMQLVSIETGQRSDIVIGETQIMF